MQRESSSPTIAVIASRISWSSAPRLSGFEILILVTSSAGSSTTSLPEARVEPSGEDNECVALGDRLPFLAHDLGNRALVLGLDRHLHLHRLEDHERVALLDGVADLALDLPHGSGDVGLDVGQLRPPTGAGKGFRHHTHP